MSNKFAKIKLPIRRKSGVKNRFLRKLLIVYYRFFPMFVLDRSPCNCNLGPL